MHLAVYLPLRRTGRPPASPGTATLSDYMSGVYAALGVLVALQSREKTGNGQIVDVGLYESVFRILDELAPAYAYKDFVRERMGAGTSMLCRIAITHPKTDCG